MQEHNIKLVADIHTLLLDLAEMYAFDTHAIKSDLDALRSAMGAKQ